MKKRCLPSRLTVLAIAVLASLAVLLTACGGKVIDHTKAEDFIRQDLAEVGVEVESVSCPKGVEVESGVDFECEVAADGEEAVVQMRIVDDEGRVKPIEIRAVEPEADKNEASEG